MSYEKRIGNMVLSGAISPTQADDLRKTMAGLKGAYDNEKSETSRKKIPVGSIAFVVIILVLMVAVTLSIANSTETNTIIQDVSETINQAGEVGNMNKSTQTMLFLGSFILLPLLLIMMTFMLTYNSLVTNEEEVLVGWAQVESNIQRRADLIPNLVTTVKTFMTHEKDVLTQVAQSRSGGLSEIVTALEELESNTVLSSVSKENLADDAFMKALAAEQSRVGQHINKLMGVVENYPRLSSSDNFMSLQAQLEGSENRINVARVIFNDAVNDYNSSIRKIPGSLVASLGHFKRKAYFQAEADHKSTEVNF